MRKTLIFVLSAVILSMAHIACDNQKTVQEYLREEKKAIDRYLDKQDIIVLKEYPKNGFGEKEYYKTNDGLYIHVVDSGNGRRVKPLIDEVQVRFEYLYKVKTYVSGDTVSTPFNAIPPYYGEFPMYFRYGQAGSYGKYSYDYSCNGWAIPLAYVGEGAVVDLIVPSDLGTSFDNTYPTFNTVFFKNLTYTKFY
ncbi:MAG: DUF4827 domain-containing protein [Candidatus Symbiothrix sp.]|jgi:hypothetical protein|nr:DUF4827 domain-containing protein [Candidatus Symbiothrix sp.]